MVRFCVRFTSMTRPKCLLQSKILLYTDDAVLFYADSNIGNISTVLNKDLKQLQSWTHLNKLCIHPVKTEYVLFGTQQRTNRRTKFLSLYQVIFHCSPFKAFNMPKKTNKQKYLKGCKRKLYRKRRRLCFKSKH